MDATTVSDAERLKRKRQHYDVFMALGQDDESIEDRGLEQSASFFSARWKESRMARAGSAHSATSAETIRAKTRASTNPHSDIQIPSRTDDQPLPLQRPPVTPRPPPTAIPRASGRSKSNFEPNLVPADQQVFRGLQFYFFPNNDINLGRRMRIVKAIQYGASWQRDLNFATHVIVDKAIDYADILSFLKLDHLPEKLTVVNETWPAECITFRVVADPCQLRFRVLGAPTSAVEEKDAVRRVPALVKVSATVLSLPLKPAGKDVQAKPPSTPRSSLQQQVTPSPHPSTTDGSATGRSDAAATSRPDNTSFEHAISQAKQLAHLPLDDEDETDSRPSSADSISSDDHHSIARAADTNKKQRLWQAGFQCMQKHSGKDDDCINASTINILQQMADHYEQINDEWRVRAYRMAIATLRKHPSYISTKEEALALPKVGQRLAAKIEEIATTNGLRRLANARLEPSEQILQTFLKIHGVGYKQAMKWVHQGMQTIDDLLQKVKLSSAQRIGIEHYEDFNMRIPRAEVEKHGKIVREGLQRIDRSFDVIIGGSYRRGSPDSSDVDCIITHPTFSLSQIRSAVHQLVQTLTKTGFLTAELSGFSLAQGSKWLGASCLSKSKVWRRIDLLLVPADELGAAKIYFTGNDIFNRSIRLLASKKGMRLNQKGLYKNVIRGNKREHVTDGTLLEGRDEKRIFEILGVPWREPHERIV